MDCELPDDYELVVIGTGMIESIVAAAASRVGKKVLHVDSNDFYGGMWASFNLEGMEKYITKPQVSSNIKLNNNNKELLKEGEDFLSLGNSYFGVKDVTQKWYISESQTIATNEENPAEPSVEPAETSKITQQSILKESRRFNLDLTPKLQFARGDFVELLISSNIARYSEYRSVSRVLTWLNRTLEVVPCSRSDVFSNTRVTVVEKRMLMKLLTTCMDDDIHFQDYQKKTFHQYLKDKKLTLNLIHYVLYAISMSDQKTLTLEGVARTKRFLNSLGKFGKTPFLFSMYGSGELPQAFCRLCAVFGGTYCLNRKVDNLVFDEQNNVVNGVVCGEQRINPKNVVISIERIPEKYAAEWKKQKISRAVFITDKSILPCDKENLTLLLFPPEDDKKPITVIELGPATGTCPQNYYVVHMSCEQQTSPEDDLNHCIDSLFNRNPTNPEILPNILWASYFTITSTNCDTFSGLPGNLYACSGPDLDLDYDESVKQARNIFAKMYPDEEFLPRAPDPEEIILCDDDDPETPTTTTTTTEETNQDGGN